jgi:hypothetical protein
VYPLLSTGLEPAANAIVSRHLLLHQKPAKSRYRRTRDETEATGDEVIPPPVLAKTTKVGSLAPDKMSTFQHLFRGT